jgi:hypothetical protein
MITTKSRYNWGSEKQFPDTCYADIELCASVFILAWSYGKNIKIPFENFMDQEIFKDHIIWITSGTHKERENKLNMLMPSLMRKLEILKSCEKTLNIKVCMPNVDIYNMDSIAFAMFVDINYQDEPYCNPDDGVIYNKFEFLNRCYTINKEEVLSDYEYSCMVKNSVILMETLIHEIKNK